MSKVITFSRQFPAYHPKAGQPTYFVEKLLNKLVPGWQFDDVYWRLLAELNDKKLKSGKLTMWQLVDFWKNLDRSIKNEKAHTIRSRHSRKQGQFLTPAVWSGRPYHDPQIIIAPDMEVKKVWDFKVQKFIDGYWIDFGNYHIPESFPFRHSILPMVARNDGLSLEDFLAWFKWPSAFDGQIICFSNDVNY